MTSEWSERVNESYIAGTSKYISYVTVIYKVFYILNVTLYKQQRQDIES